MSSEFDSIYRPEPVERLTERYRALDAIRQARELLEAESERGKRHEN